MKSRLGVLAQLSPALLFFSLSMVFFSSLSWGQHGGGPRRELAPRERERARLDSFTRNHDFLAALKTEVDSFRNSLSSSTDPLRVARFQQFAGILDTMTAKQDRAQMVASSL